MGFFCKDAKIQSYLEVFKRVRCSRRYTIHAAECENKLSSHLKDASELVTSVFLPRFLWPGSLRVCWAIAQDFNDSSSQNKSPVAVWLDENPQKVPLIYGVEREFIASCLAHVFTDVLSGQCTVTEADSRILSILSGESIRRIWGISGVEQVFDENDVFKKMQHGSQLQFASRIGALAKKNNATRASAALSLKIGWSKDYSDASGMRWNDIFNHHQGRLAKIIPTLNYLYPRVVASVACAVAGYWLIGGNFFWSVLGALCLGGLAYEVGGALADEILNVRDKPREAFILDYEKTGLPSSSACVIAVPVLLRGRDQVLRLMEVAEQNIRLANDSNVSLAILCDFGDSLSATADAQERELLRFLFEQCAAANERLGPSYPSPIQACSRDRVYDPINQIFWGESRKSGKLRDLCEYLLRSDAKKYSAVSSGFAGSVKHKKYVFVLDEDSILCRNTIQIMAGFLDHPCNVPVICNGEVISGHGLAVGVGANRANVSGTRTPGLCLHPGEFAPLMGDRQFDQFGFAKFNGKGMLVPHAFLKTCAQWMPYKYVLSHDVFEGGLLRPAYVSGTGTIDEAPLDSGQVDARDERWLRGDIQNVYAVVASWLARRSTLRYPLVPGLLIINQLLRWLPGAAIFPFIVAIGSAGSIRPYGAAVLAMVLVSAPSLIKLLSVVLIRVPSTTNEVKQVLKQIINTVIKFFKSVAFSGKTTIFFGVTLTKVWFRIICGKKLLEWRPSSDRNNNLKIATSLSGTGLLSVALLDRGSEFYNISVALIAVASLYPYVAGALSKGGRIYD